MEQLYRKVIKGKRVTYEPVAPDQEEPTVYDLTDGQALTAAGALGVTLLCLFERFIPPHKRIARKIRAVTNAILDLYSGNGHPIDQDVQEWVCKSWELAMKIAEFGPTGEHVEAATKSSS